MSVVSFVMGAEVHKTSIVELIMEKIPEHEITMYQAAFVEDLFESKRYNDLVIIDLEARVSLREVTRFYAGTDTKIAVVLTDSHLENLDEYMDYGLAGYFSVDMHIHEFVDGIHYMLDGTTYFHPLISDYLFRKYKRIAHKEASRPLGLLTRREWEVLEQIVLGGQNEQIAKNLEISDKTVKNHITSILGKLQVKDRTNAVLLALRENWFYL